MEETALIKYHEINPAVIFSDKDELEKVLVQLKNAAEAHVPDIETDDGRKAIISNAYNVSKFKKWMLNKKKELTASRRAEIKKINSLGNRVEAFCNDLRDALREPVTRIEEAEKAAREAKRKALEYESDWNEAHEINDLITRERAIAAKEKELADAEAARIAKEKAEQAEKEQMAREKRIAEEAKAQALIDAVEKVASARNKMLLAIGYQYPLDDLGTMSVTNWDTMYDAHKAAYDKKKNDEFIENLRLEKEQLERDRLKAIEDAKREKQEAIREAEERARLEAERIEWERIEVEAEKKRLADEKQAEKDRLARHKSHRKKIRREAASGFEKNCAVTFIIGETFIEAIEKGLIPHVTINF